MSDTQKLLARIDALANQKGVSPSTLSRKLFGSGKRIDEIRAGGSMTLATYERAVARLDEFEGPTAEQDAA